MSPGQTGHITGQSEMGRVPGTDGTHTTGCPAKILYVYWFFSFPSVRCQVMEAFYVLSCPVRTGNNGSQRKRISAEMNGGIFRGRGDPNMLLLTVPQSRVTDFLCGFFWVFSLSAPTD